MSLLYEELTQEIIGAFNTRCHGELGHGFRSDHV